MIVILVFRPEARAGYDGRTESHEAWEKDPFEGIEVLEIFNDDEADEAMAVVNRMADAHPTWKFSVE